MPLSARRNVYGRAAELSTLLTLVDQVREGRGGVAWVEGEPGIGKSTLVGAVLAEGTAMGCTTLQGCGNELLEAFPLRLMADCLGISGRARDPERIEIAALLQGRTRSADTVDPLLAATERMLGLVDRLCAQGPLVLAMEDLQWADEPSLQVWSRLARSVVQIPLLIIGTCRPLPRRPAVAQLARVVRERAGAVLSLGPVSAEAERAIAAQLVGADVGPVLTGELSRAGGNPLYLRELVGSLAREGLVRVSGGVADIPEASGAIPASLNGAISRRLSFLSTETVCFLGMGALLDNEFGVAEWCLALGRTVAEVTPALREAVTSGVLSDAGGRLSFRHDLLRQVLAEQLPAALRPMLHGALAQMLADTGADVDVVAQHLLLGPERIDPWVPAWLAAKPETSLYVAPEVSVALLRRALLAVEDEGPTWEALATQLAQVLFWLGQDDAGFIAAMPVLYRSRDLARTANLRILVLRAAGRMRRFEEGLAVAEAGLADESLPQVWRARLGAWAAVTMAYVTRTDEAAARACQALAHAEQCGDPLGVASAHHALAFVSGGQDQIAHINAALAVLCTDPDSAELRIMLLINLVHRLAINNRRDDLRSALPEAIRVAEQGGTYRSGQILGLAAELSFLYGDWDDAMVYADSISPEFMKNTALQYVHGLVALIALHREDQELADARLLAGRFIGPEAMERPEAVSGLVIDALALREEAAGRPDQALALRATILSMQPGPTRDARSDQVVALTRLALALEDRATAEAAVGLLQPDDRSAPEVVLHAPCCRAMLADDAAGLLDAARVYGEFGYRLHRGIALEEAAVRLARSGDLAAARTAVREAVRTYVAVGATWDARRADTRLRRWGIRRAARPVRPRATVGWDALTPSEERIARLAAQGMSNPDIAGELTLSRNTVQTHVSHILEKLQLRSRIELVREVANRGGTQPS